MSEARAWRGHHKKSWRRRVAECGGIATPGSNSAAVLSIPSSEASCSGWLRRPLGPRAEVAETARALGVSQPTARDYFDIAHGTFVWRRVPAYSGNVLKRIVRHPRGYLRDSGLLHALLRIPDRDALLSHPQMGASWEWMAVEEVLRQLAALGVGVEHWHYRTGAGAEVDLVLRGDFGLVAIEVKHTSVVDARALRPLRDFVSEQKARLGIVLNTDVTPRHYEDRILRLPLNWL